MHKKIQQKASKKKLLVYGAIVIVVVIAGPLAWNFVQARQDAKRFMQAETNKNTAFAALTEGLDGVIRTETVQRCYNSEQGPWDNGRLWCEVASAAYLGAVIPESELEDKLLHVMEQENWKHTNKRAANVEFEGAKDIECELIVANNNIATEPGYGFSNEPNAKQSVLVSCADRAKAKHYTYDD